MVFFKDQKLCPYVMADRPESQPHETFPQPQLAQKNTYASIEQLCTRRSILQALSFITPKWLMSFDALQKDSAANEVNHPVDFFRTLQPKTRKTP